MAVNKVILLGNVGADPDVRYMENDNRVAKFALATTERAFVMANGTQVPERTEWHNIVVWGSLARYAENAVRKGALVYVEGKIHGRTYEDKTGVKRFITEIYGENIQVLNRKDYSSQNNNTQKEEEQVSGLNISGADEISF